MEQKEIMQNAVKSDKLFPDLEGAIKFLTEKRLKNENVYINFNGKNLYSLIDNADSCYIKLTGENRQDFLKRAQERYDKSQKGQEIVKKVILDKSSNWIKKGEQFIYPQMKEQWERCVKLRAKDAYRGIELDNALDIMNILEKDQGYEAIRIAKKILDEADRSGAPYGITTSIILSFSKRGPEFYREICKDLKLTPEELAKVNKVLKEREEKNQLFEAELAGKKE